MPAGISGSAPPGLLRPPHSEVPAVPLQTAPLLEGSQTHKAEAGWERNKAGKGTESKEESGPQWEGQQTGRQGALGVSCVWLPHQPHDLGKASHCLWEPVPPPSAAVGGMGVHFLEGSSQH